MKKLKDFDHSKKIDTALIWGGVQNCWTHVVEKGTTKNPCGEIDDQHYMVNDDSGNGAAAQK